ncbi:Glutaredoxin [Gimesia panareensis]|uniref:Glutaredoxin n=1 Tax=Gimesia panareensis TaxID=2527978 RepID=A0A518FI91_9PLAN|nr:glutaredoxin domain-containing protein [Gimesia panareensis]QDV16067.1 Glutaredoxin [Gimesia panareensis]
MRNEFSITNVRSNQLLALMVPCFLFVASLSSNAFAESNLRQANEGRCAVLELFIRNDCENCPEVEKRVRKFAEQNGKIKLYVHNLDESKKYEERYQQILKYFQLKEATLPAAYGCNSILRNLKPDDSTERRLESLITVTAYVRSGCSKCAAAKVYLKELKQRYPGFKFKEQDLVYSDEAREKVQELSQRYGKQAVSVPVIHICNQLMIGWTGETSTGEKLESTLKYWTTDCPQEEKEKAKDTEDDPLPPVPGNDPLPPIPGGSASVPPVPGEQPPPPVVDGAPPLPAPAQSKDTIEVPLLGELSQSRLGMPAFTFLIGLVDGFNPCAMWVLLFLLSLLVNLKSRKKILAVAGTFVLISGLAYFAFMAAWLNVFLLIGYLRWVQLLLGVFATLVGLIHIKDFFAFKKGVSLSIPEWAKPGLYARMRRVVNAENLTGAIIGASILAVLVNIIELLCTAGLPALYTEILMMQNYPAWETYAYLSLYIVAYMLDDSIMVAIVVITLGKHKLQETQGRYLKLFSGVVILLLGLILIIKPSLLL